jgi:hypothetical protein
MNSNKHLDEQIRKALENLQAKHNGLAWEAFEQRLDEATANDAPNQEPVSSFDDAISKKLGQVEVPFTAGDWGRLEKRIEAEEAAELLESEAALDNMVSEKLENFKVAFQPHHWQMMAHRLEEEFFFRYHLIRCKAAEAGLMALLLLTIVHFSPIIQRDFHGIPPFAPLSLPPSKQKPLKETASPNNTPAATSRKAPIATILRQPTGEPLLNQSHKTAKAKALAAVTELPIKAEFAPANQKRTAASAALPPLPMGTVSALGIAHSLYEQMTERHLMQNDMVTPGQSRSDGSTLLASLEAQPVQSNYAWEMPLLPEKFFPKEAKLRFSLFTSTDVAYVLTPPNTYSVFDTLVATGQDTTLASGYGGGITIGWKKGRWEFQTGGIYSFKRYIPNTPVFLFETVNYYIREEFNGVQLDMLELPLHANYHFKNQGKWRVYGSLGASGHVVTSSVYEIKTDKTPSFSKLAMLPVPNHLPDDDKSIREDKDFPDGLFDGGNIHDNFYLTANVGMGVERFVSPRWCLFFQPNYQHYFLTDGIGANGEKLYNFSFYLGTKVSLK